MDPLDVMVLVSLVKPGGSRWTVEAAIVTRLAQLRGGGWCWAAQAAEWTGADAVVCRRALSSLEERRVIKRDPGDSGRDNIRWCAVNDDWRRWRVEWLVDASQVAAQLALAQRQREESPLTRVFARSLSARSLGRIARSFDARSWADDLAELENLGGGDPTHRALQIARSVGRRRPALERAIRGGEPSGGSRSGVKSGKTPPPMVRTRSEEERCRDLGAEALKGRILIMATTAPNARDKWLAGAPLREFNDLVEQHGVDHIEKRRSMLPVGVSSPPRIVTQLAALALLSDDELDPVGPADLEEGPRTPPEYFTADKIDKIDEHERQAGLEAVRSLKRQRWQDEPRSGEDTEAIAQ